MADFTARLKVDSQEYDSKLKNAVAQMNQMEQTVRRTGATFAVAEKEELEFVQSLGSLGTQATSAKQKLREYSDAITSLTATYRNMTDEEKRSDVGKALAASIDQLKVKASELNDIMSDTQREISNLASDTAFTDGLNMMTRTIGASASAIVAWTGDSKEMEAVIKDLAKIGTTVAAVDQLTKAFQKQNLVLLKNPYVAAAAAVVALGVAIGKLVKKSQELSAVDKALQDVQQKGRENSAQEITRIDTLNSILHDNTRSLEERKTALAEIQNLVPDYHGALTEEGNLINDNTGAIDDYIDSLQRAALAQAAFDKMVELQKKKMQQQVELQEKQNQLKVEQARNQQAQGQVVYAGSEMTQVYTQQGENAAARAVQKVEADIRQTEAEIEAVRNLVRANDIGTTTSTVTKTKTTTKTKEDVILPEGSIAELEQKIKEKREELRMAITQDSRDAISKDIEGLQKQLDTMLGKMEQEPVEIQIEFNEDGISQLKRKFSEQLGGATIGSGDYMIAAENIADINAFENLLKTAIDAGIDPSIFEGKFESLKTGINISDEAWEELVTQINEQLANLGLDPIVLDVKTGNIETAAENLKSQAKGVGEGWNAVASAVNTVGGALQQIEDPGAKIAGIVAQAVANIALSFAEAAASPAVTSTGWGWLGFAAAGIATMISTIASIKSVTAGSYASGGIVPGNSYSGDNLTANVNSGELILNRAQQDSVASQLQGNNPFGNLALSMVLKGEDIQICLDNNRMRRGR